MDTVTNPELAKIRLLIEQQQYEKAKSKLETLHFGGSPHADSYKLLAHCHLKLADYDAYFSALEALLSINYDLQHEFFYVSELITYAREKTALEYLEALFAKPTFKPELKQFLNMRNVLAQRSYQFYFKQSLVLLKKELTEVANNTVQDSLSSERVNNFIENLFDLANFETQSESDFHKPSYIGYAGLKESCFVDSEKVISREKYLSIKQNIVSEVLSILESNQTVPYIKDRDGVPNGLQHLRANSNWSSLSIYEAGSLKIPEAKKLVMLLEENFMLADCSPMSPEVMISILKPGTHITPHYGISNIKETMHIPILLPNGDLGIKVGNEKRSWNQHEPLIFDDSFIHEAWNYTDEIRIVLIVDIWHHDLSVEERRFLSRVFPKLSNWRDKVAL